MVDENYVLAKSATLEAFNAKVLLPYLSLLPGKLPLSKV